MSNTFKTMLKYELKKQLPIKRMKQKSDIFGYLISFVITIGIVGLLIYFLSIMAKNYVDIKIDKVADRVARAYELANLFYLVATTVMIFISLEDMRKTLTDTTDKRVLLSLPIKEQTLFIAKIIVFGIKNYILAFLFVLPINWILFVAVAPGFVYWIMTLVVWLILPLVVMFFNVLLIIPYIKIMNFIKNRYLLIFLVLSVILIGFVVFYISFLSLVQDYLSTGYIKFLFNENFIGFLQTLLVWTYPVNCLAGLVLGKNILISILVLLSVIGLAVAGVYYVTKKLYFVALYKDQQRKRVYKKVAKVKQLSTLFALIKKEFIAITREPKHIFSYLVIASIMPILIYCCYTLFESLILNILGVSITFSLALFVVVIFTVLTNTFCATNIAREGISILKQKTLPIKASQLLTAKVLFCFAVSFLSVLVSILVLIFATSLTFGEGLVCFILGISFSFAQILVATKMDLNNTKLSLTNYQIQKMSSNTVAKVVIIGLIVSIVTGLASLIISISSKINIASISLHISYSYILPIIISMIYVSCASWYYFKNLQKSLDSITR